MKSVPKTVNYILKYLVKGYIDEHGMPCVSPVFCSPGLGKAFALANKAGFITSSNRPIFTLTLNDPAYRYAVPKYYHQFVFDKDFVKDYLASSPPPDYRCGNFRTDDYDQWLRYVNAIPAVMEYRKKLAAALYDRRCRDLFINQQKTEKLWEYSLMF